MSSRSLASPPAPPRNLYLNERFPATRDAMLVRVFQLTWLEEPEDVGVIWVCQKAVVQLFLVT